MANTPNVIDTPSVVDEVHVDLNHTADKSRPDTTGSVGLHTQMNGQATTATGISTQTGGYGNDGSFMQPSVDEQLFSFKGFANAPLLMMMLKTAPTPVDSAKVKHFMIDEERSSLTVNNTTENATGDTVVNRETSFILHLESADKLIPREYQTLLVPDINGYEADGTTRSNMPLMLYVVGRDTGTNNPICVAVNGGASASIPIPNGTEIITMANMLYETQATVPPDSYAPQSFMLNLQKRGVTQVVSDYYDKQRKQIPFEKAAQFEQSIKNFFLRSDRTLLAGVPCEVNVDTKLGVQKAFGTTGLRWQVLREMQHSGSWTFEALIGLMKMFFCGDDAPETGIWFCGQDLIESLQCIDFSKHPEATLSVMKNETMGWVVSNIHTAFGDVQLKHLPALDKMHWSNCGLLLGMGKNRLKHYQFSQQHDHKENVEGEEAKLNSTIVWDALGLKGTCHIWVDGGSSSANSSAVVYRFWDEVNSDGDGKTPTATDVTSGAIANGIVYYFTHETVLNNLSGSSVTATTTASRGSMYKATITGEGSQGDPYVLNWTEYHGTLVME